MAKRATWEFEYSAAVLLGAAAEKQVFHTGRWDYWQAELKDAERDLRENGIDVRAVVRGGATGSNAYRSEAMLDNAKVTRMAECNNKIAEHRELAAAYARFMRALEREAPDRLFALQVEDIEYFGL